MYRFPGYISLGWLTMANSAEKNAQERRPNRLISEKSPYLLQHAYNPVDWYPWDDEAFEKASTESKPIFLSIGYSTCHWCHVMERESFEHPDVARLMNETFVSIKVDREERPDIDGVYMTVCQMMTGGGGWPLTIIMTPDKKPFFAGTYIPRETQFGRIGMMELVPRVKDLWEQRNEEVISSAEKTTALLAEVSEAASGEELGEEVLRAAYQQLASGDATALQMVERTLQKMRLGGICDHVGFGFHRYSTDARWLVPHFEKMLYDQALLAIAYIDAYQATRKDEYRETAREIFTYVLRDMTAPEGGFYSAEDADVEGEEGKFYIWKEEEIRQVLPADEADLIINAFGVEPSGNFAEEATGNKTGTNILFLGKPLFELADGRGVTEADLRKRIESARLRLFAAREKRVRPHKDDKILTDWNGLMIAALAKGARVLDEPVYADAAIRAIRFILAKLRDSNGRLMHRYRDGEAAVPGFLDDYAFLIWGLVELYETTFDVLYLRTALGLNSDLLEHFWDEESGGLYFTADDAENLLVRKKEIYDGAVPSGNAVTMLNLLRLGRMTADPELERRAARIAQAFSATVQQSPAAYTQLLVAVDFALGPSCEVVIVGDLHADDTQAMLKALRGQFAPISVVLFRPDNAESPEISRLAKFTLAQRSIDGKATAYVCSNYACKRPTTDADEMLRVLASGEE